MKFAPLWPLHKFLHNEKQQLVECRLKENGRHANNYYCVLKVFSSLITTEAHQIIKKTLPATGGNGNSNTWPIIISENSEAPNSAIRTVDEDSFQEVFRQRAFFPLARRVGMTLWCETIASWWMASMLHKTPRHFPAKPQMVAVLWPGLGMMHVSRTACTQYYAITWRLRHVMDHLPQPLGSVTCCKVLEV